MTTTNSWLPLAEYSNKHRVSVSTLRRRIKADDIRYRFEDGKYFILDESLKKSAEVEQHRPSLNSEVAARKVLAGAPAGASISPTMGMDAMVELQQMAGQQMRDTNESVLSAANKLLGDLKKAYTQVLHEKEEQIMNLKEEVVDLKTLVKVLEAENSRLREWSKS